MDPTPDRHASDPDQALASVLVGEDAGVGLSPADLEAATGMPPAVLEALARDGLLHPRPGPDGEPLYAPEDAEAVRAGVALLEAGVPLGELLALARRADAALRDVAESAVDAFVAFVRDPIHGSAASTQEASDRLVTAYRTMLPAAVDLVGTHLARLLRETALARLEAEGDADQIAVARRESARLAAGG